MQCIGTFFSLTNTRRQVPEPALSAATIVVATNRGLPGRSAELTASLRLQPYELCQWTTANTYPPQS